jgi:hypothetical protein
MLKQGWQTYNHDPYWASDISIPILHPGGKINYYTQDIPHPVTITVKIGLNRPHYILPTGRRPAKVHDLHQYHSLGLYSQHLTLTWICLLA